jgi:hypothetical protein
MAIARIQRQLARFVRQSRIATRTVYRQIGQQGAAYRSRIQAAERAANASVQRGVNRKRFKRQFISEVSRLRKSEVRLRQTSRLDDLRRTREAARSARLSVPLRGRRQRATRRFLRAFKRTRRFVAKISRRAGKITIPLVGPVFGYDPLELPQALRWTANLMRHELRQLIKVPYPPPSKPGEPPHRRTGRLWTSMDPRVERRNHIVIYGMGYGRFLEDGTKHMDARPFLEPTIHDQPFRWAAETVYALNKPATAKRIIGRSRGAQ